MYKSYIDYKNFFEFLYKKPKNIYQETDIILSNSKSENKNEGKMTAAKSMIHMSVLTVLLQRHNHLIHTMMYKNSV